MSNGDPLCTRRRGRLCRAPLSEHHPVTMQCPRMPGGSTFREHSGSLKRAGNSFSMEEAKILETVFESMLHGKLNEQVIRGYVRQHPALLLGLAKKGRKMVAAIKLMQEEAADERVKASMTPGAMIEKCISEALKAS